MYLYLKDIVKQLIQNLYFFIDVDRVIRKQSLDINNKNELIIKKNEINKFKEFLNEKFYNYLIENSNLFQFIKKIYIISTGNYIDYVDKKLLQKKNKKTIQLTIIKTMMM